ncbi:hypothetical protein [Sandaracinus amylolyticus]|uniref:Uncharacterized protein n=1 Tax=Sandaracinus amylolyticus TaxID=927083 RepID=A0A0F6W764_9BACT|nr:hypothetical protein [Sandaracinus amylolyticus]AKF09033.1 hypothetical protein DB32_006182 [Sandaracinus amylolyticus]
MGLNRLFVSQSKLDQWLSEELVDVDGEVMTTKNDGNRFNLKTAVLFLEEVTGAGDPSDLIGKVKDLEQIQTVGGEYASGSVILGDHAYNVVEGFVGDPILDGSTADAGAANTGDTLAAAMRSITGDPAREGELDLLARFFLASRGT